MQNYRRLIPTRIFFNIFGNIGEKIGGLRKAPCPRFYLGGELECWKEEEVTKKSGRFLFRLEPNTIFAFSKVRVVLDLSSSSQLLVIMPRNGGLRGSCVVIQ